MPNNILKLLLLPLVLFTIVGTIKISSSYIGNIVNNEVSKFDYDINKRIYPEEINDDTIEYLDIGFINVYNNSPVYNIILGDKTIPMDKLLENMKYPIKLIEYLLSEFDEYDTGDGYRSCKEDIAKGRVISKLCRGYKSINYTQVKFKYGIYELQLIRRYNLSDLSKNGELELDTWRSEDIEIIINMQAISYNTLDIFEKNNYLMVLDNGTVVQLSYPKGYKDAEVIIGNTLSIFGYNKV